MQKTFRYAVWWITFTTVLLFSVTVFYNPRAAAHDWYPQECCNKNDCDPVEKVEIVPPQKLLGGSPAIANLGKMFVTTKRGTVEVPATVRRRESKDGRMHACMRVSDGINRYGDAPVLPPSGTLYLLCIFLPPPM